MVWLPLGLSLFLSHIVTVCDLLAAVIVNVDVHVKTSSSLITFCYAAKPKLLREILIIDGNPGDVKDLDATIHSNYKSIGP